MSAELDADVVVVGCGPVGSALAILLGRAGRSVVVLERWPEPYPLPRAVHFDHEVGRLLQACGIGAELRASSEPAPVYEWRNGEGLPLLRIGRIGDGASGWPESSMFNQPTLEAQLARRAGELPTVDIRRGIEVTGIEPSTDDVIVRTAAGEEIRAAYVIGCDGANSTVRTAAGIAVRDLGFSSDWLIVDVILDKPRLFEPLNVQICDPGRPTTAVSGGPGRRRWEFMRLPHETLDDLGCEQRAWELLAAWDVHPGNARLERHAVYTFKAHYAEQWGVGRVLLAGDAAHLMPPFAGQGMCAGIRDAANLAWKLDLVLDCRAAETLLDTYQRERLPHVRNTIEFSIALGGVICVSDPDEAAARDAGMAPAVGAELSEAPPLPGIDDGLIHHGAPHAGSLFVQGTVNGLWLDDVHGAGWRLVTVDTGHAVQPDVQRWFEDIGGRVVALADPDDTYRHWFDEHETLWALQRPDFHLYGTAVNAVDASALVVDLREQLGLAGI